MFGNPRISDLYGGYMLCPCCVHTVVVLTRKGGAYVRGVGQISACVTDQKLCPRRCVCSEQASWAVHACSVPRLPGRTHTSPSLQSGSVWRAVEKPRFYVCLAKGSLSVVRWLTEFCPKTWFRSFKTYSMFIPKVTPTGVCGGCRGCVAEGTVRQHGI